MVSIKPGMVFYFWALRVRNDKSNALLMSLRFKLYADDQH